MNYIFPPKIDYYDILVNVELIHINGNLSIINGFIPSIISKQKESTDTTL